MSALHDGDEDAALRRFAELREMLARQAKI